MDGSRVIVSLDSLWFYTNILTCSEETELPSLTHQFEASIESPKRDECESQKNVENMLCHKCDEELGLVKGNSEVRKSGKEKEKRGRRMRRKRNEAEAIFGGLGLGFDVKDLSATQMPSIDDDVAMKQHLKSWAYAVACTVK